MGLLISPTDSPSLSSPKQRSRRCRSLRLFSGKNRPCLGLRSTYQQLPVTGVHKNQAEPSSSQRSTPTPKNSDFNQTSRPSVPYPESRRIPSLPDELANRNAISVHFCITLRCLNERAVGGVLGSQPQTNCSREHCAVDNQGSKAQLDREISYWSRDNGRRRCRCQCQRYHCGWMLSPSLRLSAASSRHRLSRPVPPCSVGATIKKHDGMIESRSRHRDGHRIDSDLCPFRWVLSSFFRFFFSAIHRRLVGRLQIRATNSAPAFPLQRLSCRRFLPRPIRRSSIAALASLF